MNSSIYLLQQWLRCALLLLYLLSLEGSAVRFTTNAAYNAAGGINTIHQDIFRYVYHYTFQNPGVSNVASFLCTCLRNNFLIFQWPNTLTLRPCFICNNILTRVTEIFRESKVYWGIWKEVVFLLQEVINYILIFLCARLQHQMILLSLFISKCTILMYLCI